MKPEFCQWCDAPVKVQDDFDPRKQSAVCSVGCKDAEWLFRSKYSDEAIKRREHYQQLTEGGDNEAKVQGNQKPDAEA